MGSGTSSTSQQQPSSESQTKLAELLDSLGATNRSHDAEIHRLFAKLRRVAIEAGVCDVSKLLKAASEYEEKDESSGQGAAAGEEKGVKEEEEGQANEEHEEDNSAFLRLAELEALESTITTQVSTARRYHDQLVEVKTVSESLRGTGGEEHWMNNPFNMGEGRTVKARLKSLESEIKQAEDSQKLAEDAITSLRPLIVADNIPELIRTRRQFRTVFEGLNAADLAQLGKVLEPYRDGWEAQTLTLAAVQQSNVKKQELLPDSLKNRRFFTVDDAAALEKADVPDHTDRSFFRGMVHDARRALPVFCAALERIASRVSAKLNRPGAVHAIVAPMKHASRALAKVFRSGSYFGNYAQVTDLVRGTLACDALDAAVLCAEALAEEVGDIALIFAQNRLAPEFNATSCGGYRDVLTLVRCEGHICEVQLNLEAFLRIKEKGGGHHVYEAARKVGLFDPRVNTYIGFYSEKVMESVEMGMVTDLTLASESINKHRLVKALGSATCQVRSLALQKIERPRNQYSPELFFRELFAGKGLADTLQHVDFGGSDAIGGEFPPLEQLPNLRVLKLAGMGLGSSVVPIGEGLATHPALQELVLFGNSIQDKGAAAIGKGLATNTSLLKLYLSYNSIRDEGGAAIGDGLATNTVLQELLLNNNSIGGKGGAAIGKGLKTNTALQKLHLFSNPIERAVQSDIRKVAEGRSGDFNI